MEIIKQSGPIHEALDEQDIDREDIIGILFQDKLFLSRNPKLQSSI